MRRVFHSKVTNEPVQTGSYLEQARALLADARLVIEYSCRVGLLDEQSTLITDVKAVSEAIAAGDQHPDLAALYVSLNKAVKSISPHISLEDLRGGASTVLAQSPTGSTARVPLRYAISHWSIILFFFGSFVGTMFCVVEWRDDVTRVKEINQIFSAEPRQLVDKIYGSLIVNRIYNDRSSSAFHDYYETKSRAQHLEYRIFSINQDEQERAGATFVTTARAYVRKAWLDLSGGSIAEIYSQGVVVSGFSLAKPVAPSSPGAANPGVSALGGSQLSFQEYIGSQASPDQIKKDLGALAAEQSSLMGDMRRVTASCASSGNSLPRDLNKAFEDSELRDCVVKTLRLPAGVELAQLWHHLNRITRQVYMLEAWKLPILSGLLGASVYLIYIFFDPLKPTWSFSKNAFRFLLGGIAGLIIGWFYAPARLPADELYVVDASGQFPFMWAFIAGFSADFAFTTMNSLIDGANRRMARMKERPAEG